MVQCHLCNLQYLGETKRRLKDRFNEHRRAVDKTNIKSKPTTVSPQAPRSFRFQVSSVQLVRMKVYKNHPCARARVFKWMASSFSL